MLQCYTEEGRRFGDKVFNLTGMSRHGTYIPPWINPQHVDAPENNLDRAHDEAIVSFVGTVRQLLDKTSKSHGTSLRALSTCLQVLLVTCSSAVGLCSTTVLEYLCLIRSARPKAPQPARRSCTHRALCIHRMEALPAKSTAVPIGYMHTNSVASLMLVNLL